MSSSRLSAVVLSIGALILMGGCQQASTTHGDLTQGVWAGEGGVETFYWDISLVDSSYAGVIHTVRDGKKQTELPISRVTWQPPQLEMLMAATGVTYRGRVDFDKGRIDGQLFYGEDEGPPMELNLVDPHQVPGLSPRPTDLPYAYKQPPTTDDGLATASCRTMGMEPEAVGELVAEICSGRAGVIHSLLILAEGQLVVEEYFHGYDRESLHRLASVTKSVSSLLLGLAIDHGEVPGVEARLLDYFPELNRPTDDRWQAETIHHLLSMSMGWIMDRKRIPTVPGLDSSSRSSTVKLLMIRARTGPIRAPTSTCCPESSTRPQASRWSNSPRPICSSPWESRVMSGPTWPMATIASWTAASSSVPATRPSWDCC